MTMSIPSSIMSLLSWNLDDLQAAKVSSPCGDHGKKKACHLWHGNVASRFVTVGQSRESRFQHLQRNSWLSASLLLPQRVQCICFSSRTCYGFHTAVVRCIHVSFFYHHHCICCCNLHCTIANIIYYLVFYNIWQRSQSTEILLMHLRKSVFQSGEPESFSHGDSHAANKIICYFPKIWLKVTQKIRWVFHRWEGNVRELYVLERFFYCSELVNVAVKWDIHCNISKAGQEENVAECHVASLSKVAYSVL